MQPAITKLSNTKKNELVKRFSQRFNYDKIINEDFYIKHMTPKMMIRSQILQKDQLFKDLHVSVIQQIFKQIPFFKLIKTHIKIQYENADRILVITGIKKNFLNQFVDQWIKDYNYNRRSVIIREANFIFWHLIQLQSNDIAFALKRFIRMKKVEKDQVYNQIMNKRQLENSYKFTNRRVRIIFLNQDFFTILVDLISESNHQKFAQAIQNRGEIPIPFKNLIYVPIYSIEKGDEPMEEVVDDAASSQMLSRTSQVFQNSNINRMRQIDIETSNQGTQIQIIGIQIQTQLQNSNKIQQKREDLRKSNSFSGQLKNQAKIQQNNIHDLINQPQNTQVQNQVHARHNSQNFENNIKNKIVSKKTMKKSPEKKQIEKSKSKEQQFPALVKRNSIQNNVPQMPNQIEQALENASLEKIQFLEMKRRYNAYLKQTQSQGRRQIDIPQYIKKESESLIYKKKFYHQVIRRAQQIKISRRVSYL